MSKLLKIKLLSLITQKLVQRWLFYVSKMSGKVTIDNVGNSRGKWTPREFMKFYEENSEELDKIPTETLNNRVNISEGLSKFKVIRRKGKTIIQKVQRDQLSLRQMNDLLLEIEQRICQLENDFRNYTGADDSEEDSGERLLERLQDKKRIDKEEI